MSQILAVQKNAKESIFLETEIHEILKEKTVEIVKSIVFDSFKRQDYEKNSQLLGKGIFYAQDYYEALKKTNQQTRLDYLKKNGNFFHGYTSPKYFSLVSDTSTPTGKAVATFILKKGAIPSEALKDIREGLSLLGCAEVCQIAQYGAIETALGKDKFNMLFSADSSTPLVIGSQYSKNPISRLRVYLMTENPSEKEIKKGDQVNIKNVSFYFAKHLNGASSSYNAICVDDTVGAQKFTTLGLFHEGNTHSEIKETLLNEYNQTYKSLESYSEELKNKFINSFKKETIETSEKLKIHKIDIKQFEIDNAGKLTILCELDVSRITALANSSLEEARRLLDGYDVRIGRRFSK